MEPIAHLEWTVGFALIVAAIFNFQFDAVAIFLLGIGSSFPDLFDLFVFRGTFAQGHREISHTLIFIVILWLPSLVWPPFIFLVYGSILHIIEDILAGGSPVHLLLPFTRKGGIMIISKEKTIKIGGKARNLFKGSYVGSENIGNELSWFWLQTILGAYIMVIGILFYFSG